MGSKARKGISAPSISAPTVGAGAMSLTLIVIAIALFVLTRSYIVFFFQPQDSDVPMYFGYAARAVDLHHEPYQKDFEVPYPPLALWTTCAPRFFDDRSITRPKDATQVMPIFKDYTNLFRVMMFFCDLASFILFLLIVWKRCPRLAGWAALIYTITLAVLGHVLYDRLDVGLLMLLILAVYAWTRSFGESPWAISWSTMAYAFIGLSISFKLIPVISVPFLLLADIYAPRRIVRLTAGIVAMTLGICVPFFIQYLATGPGVFDVFKFHAERVIHLESLYSSLMMIGTLFGPKAYVSHSHGAFDLSGDLSSVMIMLSNILLLGFLAGMGIWSFLRWSRFSRQDAYRLTCFVIPTAVILSKVLSPQYFVWAFPPILLLAVEIFPEGRVSPWVLGALLIVVAATTIWVFPYNFFCTESNLHALVPMAQMDNLDPYALPVYIVLGLRNFLYLGVILWLGVMLFTRINRLSNYSTSPKNVS